MRGHCRKNCNFDYLNRLAFRIFLQRLNLKHKSFVLVHNLHDEIFFPVIQYLIVELCTCYTEPHLSMTCPRTSQNTKQYHSWTKNREKLWMIFDLLALRPISHITQKTLSFLHSKRIEQITMGHFSLQHSLRPILPQTSVQRLAHTRNVTTCCFCSHLLYKFL